LHSSNRKVLKLILDERFPYSDDPKIHNVMTYLRMHECPSFYPTSLLPHNICEITMILCDPVGRHGNDNILMKCCSSGNACGSTSGRTSISALRHITQPRRRRGSSHPLVSRRSRQLFLVDIQVRN
jgi:hypothetical protein